jgi:hypothetical protein
MKLGCESLHEFLTAIVGGKFGFQQTITKDFIGDVFLSQKNILAYLFSHISQEEKELQNITEEEYLKQCQEKYQIIKIKYK